MRDLFERYLYGECKNVWIELMEIQQTNKIPEYRSDIDKILKYIMTNVKNNIYIILNSLKEFDYVFTDFEIPSFHDERLPLVIAQDIDRDNLDLFVNSLTSFGKLPMSFIYFYKEITSIDLRGYFPSWTDNDRPALDPMFMDPISIIRQVNNIEQGKLCSTDDEKCFIAYSMDAYCKEGESQGTSYGILLNNEELIDNMIINYEINDIKFLDYLRLCFQWCGFPGLNFTAEKDIPDKISLYLNSTRAKLHPI